MVETKQSPSEVATTNQDNHLGGNGNGEDQEVRPKIKYSVEHIYPDERPLGVPVPRNAPDAFNQEESEKTVKRKFENQHR